ncbi:MAG: 23S rRNA (uracil(1939)-C(5))-methyltransferase RlmD [Bacilli bacterium]|nr:23S rRNA (uracil(1939)-C(5))-methyltransferase RlmD [Bacilli bacterium]
MNTEESRLQVNQKVLLTIKRMGINGEGIAYYKKKAVFIPNALTGEVVEVIITKVLDTYAYGEITMIKKKSSDRIEPKCPYYGKCGGCQLEHASYPFQLDYKKEIVMETFERFYEGKLDKVEIRNTLGMDNPWNYRNKSQLPTRHDGEKVVVGMYEHDSNRLVYIDKCLIEEEGVQDIREKILDYLTKASINIYNPRFHQGNLRYIVIRGFKETNSYQVTFVIIKEEERLLKILKDVIKLDDRIKSVNYSVNSDPKSIEILGPKVTLINGKEKIDGYLGDLKFSISPSAFFQLNTKQTKVIYDEVVKAISPTGSEKVLDLYCGIGSIGLYLSKLVKEVRGIDINKEGIEDAKEFAKINNINNAFFYSGNILKILDKFKEEKYEFDVVVVDPPRKGVELQLLNYLKKSKIKKIVYVSCNPATLVKNLNHLQKDYNVKYVQPIDVFSQTSNIEAVVCLTKK